MPPTIVPALCSRCNGSGWIPLPGDHLRVEPCECQGDLRRHQRLASASIPKRYEHCSLDTFREKTTVLKNAKRRVQEFVDLCRNRRRKGPAADGRLAVGKTHLPCGSRGDHQQRQARKLVFSNFQDLIQEIQSRRRRHGHDEGGIMRPILEADLLVLASWARRSRPSSCRHPLLRDQQPANNEDGPPLHDQTTTTVPRTRRRDARATHRHAPAQPAGGDGPSAWSSQAPRIIGGTPCD